MLNKINEKFIGLDISGSVLRFAQTKKLGSKINLISAGEINLPAGIIENGLIMKSGELSVYLKKLLKNKSVKQNSRQVNVCLPEQKTFIKVIEAPQKKSKNILFDIIEEAEKHIPYPLESCYIDWQYTDDKVKDKIIIAVCPKETVESYQNVLKDAGLIPVSLEVEAAAIARALFPLNHEIAEPSMIIDFGALRSSLIIYDKNYIPFTLSLSTSGQEITDIIVKTLSLSAAEAEMAKKAIGLDKGKAGGGIFKLLSEELNDLSEDTREAKYFYTENFSSKEISKLYLTGSGSNMPGLATYLNEKTGLKTEIGNPLFNINENKAKLSQDKHQSYATAIGLSLRQFIS